MGGRETISKREREMGDGNREHIRGREILIGVLQDRVGEGSDRELWV